MKISSMYGFKSLSLDEVRELLENESQLTFKMHESSYKGIYYVWGDIFDKNVVIQENFSAYDNDWQEPRFREHKILVFINKMEVPNIATLRSANLLEDYDF